MERIGVSDMRMRRKPPSLVDLCVETAIDNVRYLGDVGETDIDLLGRILPHCTVDQLLHIEKSTKGRDLSSVTDPLWKKFYEKKFGSENTYLVIKRMKALKGKSVSFRWMQLYEAKLKEVEKAQDESLDRIRQLYKKEDARKQSRQVQFCAKVPPSNKRSWGNGPGYNVGDSKSNLMKKIKIDFQKSREAKNMAAMKKNAIQRSSSVTRPGGFHSKGSASTFQQVRPMQVRPPMKRF